MMKITPLLFVAILIAALAGCDAPAPQIQTVEVTRIVEQPVEVTRIVEQTVVATQLVTVVVTATPLPHTATPTITPTPEYQRWVSADAIAAFQAAGLDVGNTWVMTKDDYGLGPMVAEEGTRFLIPSLCADCGGRVLSFSSPERLEASKAYYDKLSEASAMFFSWLFVKDNILVQINGDLPEARAREYEAALNNLK